MGKKMAVTLIVAGAALTAFTCLLFAGFGIWTVPGLAVIAAGLAGIVAAGKGKNFGLGLGIVFCAVALFVAALPHVLLGWMQIVAIVIAVIGLIVMFAGKKA